MPIDNVKNNNGESLEKRLQTMPEPHKQVLQLCSVIYEPTVRTHLFTAAQQCGIKNENGKGFNHKSFKDLLDRLIAAGFLELSDNRYQCRDDVVEDLTWNAARENNLNRFAETIRNHRELRVCDPYYLNRWMRYGYIGFEKCIRELRIAVYSKDIDTVTQYIDMIKESFPEKYDRFHIWDRLFNSPFNPRRFGDVPLQVQIPIMQDITPPGILELNPMDDMAVFLKEYCENRAAGALDNQAKKFFLHYYLTLLLSQGKIKEAGRLMVLDPEVPNSYFLKAWLDFLMDKTETAIETYRQGLKIYRKLTGKRPSYHPHIANLLYILMLIKTDAPNHTGTINTIVKQAVKQNPPYADAYMAFKAYTEAKENRIKDAERILEQCRGYRLNVFSLLMVALVTAWFFPDNLVALESQLTQCLRRAKKNGYQWFALQYSSLLARCVHSSRPYEELAAQLQETTGTGSLLPVVKTEAPWERSLKAILNFCSENRDDAVNNRTNRLVWFLRINQYGIDIFPKLQSRKPGGTWTGGRAVALKRLKDRQVPCMTLQDHKITSAVVKENNAYYYNKESYYIDPGLALPAMVGHPLVFREADPPMLVELVGKELEIVIKPEKGGFRINFSIPLGLPDVYVKEESPNRLVVIKVSAKQRRIADIIGPKGLKIPAKGKDKLQDIVKSLSSVVTVQSELEEQRKDIPAVPADSTIYIRFLPLGEGLKMELLVRPFAGGNHYYKPGAGGARLVTHIKGKSIQTTRNLAEETANYSSVLSRCPTLAGRDDGSAAVVLEKTEDVLPVLLELDAIKDDIVMEWPEGEKITVRPQVYPRQIQVKVKQAKDWFSIEGELKVDDSLVLSLRQLLELLEESPSRFIPLGKGQFIALTETFRRRLRELNSMTRKSGKNLGLHPLAALSLEDLWDELNVKGDNHWRKLRKRIRQVKEYNPPLPSTLQGQLREYQEEGFKWLSRLAYLGMGACLADDMGLGKTVQAISVILQRAADGPTLVVAPKSVSLNWTAEAYRFAPTLNPVLFGGKDRQNLLDNIGPFDLLVCSYGLLQQESERLAAVKWTTIVLDEAQAIKNITALRTRAALNLQGDFKIITTGTPIENHLGELWSLFSFINPGLLGTLNRFNRVFAGPIQEDNSAEARRRLKRIVQPFILRRIKSEVLEELPEKTEILLPVEMDEQEAAFYEALRREALEKIENTGEPEVQKRFKVLAEIMRLRRACCHPTLAAPGIEIGGSKLALLGQLVDELKENRHKALIFSQFTDHLAIIRRFLDEKGIDYQYLDGSTSLKNREKSIRAFQAGQGELFLISLRAGGFGLNLTAANYVIHMDPWWNPAVEDQASDRVHRIGQQRPVTIYRLVTSNTIEEKIVKLHKTKRDLADSLLAGTDASAALSVDQLIELIGSV